MVHAPESTLLQCLLVEKIGAGDMGEVWRAHDVTLDREIAPRFLPPGAARDATVVERFLAAAMWGKALEMRPEDHQASLLRAQVLGDPGRHDKTRASRERGFRNAQARLELNPDDVGAVCVGANPLVGMGDIARGLEWAERAVAIDPGGAGSIRGPTATNRLITGLLPIMAQQVPRHDA